MNNDLPTPGLSAFDSLRAEDEPWLEHCFVPPPEFDLISGARSVVVFGGPGAGKTALYRALRQRLSPAGARPSRLSFEWQPLADAAPDVQLERVLSVCAEALLSHLAHWPSVLGAAPGYARKTLTWFAHRYQAGSLGRLVDELGAKVDETGRALLRDLAASTMPDQYLDAAAAEQTIAELTKALLQTGLADVCVLVSPDELGPPGPVSVSLGAFLSTLRLFENPRFIYKLILPADLEPTLSRAGGVVRHRLDRYQLRWLEHDLTTIVEQRLWLASGGQVGRLGDVCEDKKLAAWLARCSGASPRGWLNQTRPLAAHFLNLGRAVTTQEWHQIRRIHPPKFWIDEEQRRVTVGHRQIWDLPDTEWAILHYLYQHRDRVCSRDELYHKAHLAVSGAADTEQRFFPKEYEGALNNALLRLRQAIEPDPRTPLFVVTHKGKGVKLEHAW